MSHFTVMVIGPDIADQLQPFHEFECTGIKDQYVIEVDVTDEVALHFDGEIKAVRWDGKWYSLYDDRFYTEPPEHTWSSKRFKLPAGAEEITLTGADARAVGLGHATMADAARDYFGSGVIVRDGAYFRLTNLNKKWDWWQLGGRWTGFLKLKPQARGLVGKPGLMTDRSPAGYADQAYKGDIDFEQMRNDEAVKARALWKETRRLTGGAGWESWSDTLLRYPGDNKLARDEFWAQPALEILKASGKQEYAFAVDDDLALDEDIYVERQRAAACCTFALLKDGHWSERGNMGWWGAVSGAVSDVQWHSMFNAMLDALPDDALVSIVDCHI